MITRIVKLTFQPEKITDFITYFDTIKEKVAGYPRCHGMKLLQDIHQPNVVYTYSYWEDEKALDDYRYSELFGAVWPTIKPWFLEKAEARSVTEYFSSFPVEVH